MSVIFAVGAWGGFYWHRGYTIRVCLGWVSISYFPHDIDDVLAVALPILVAERQPPDGSQMRFLAKLLDIPTPPNPRIGSSLDDFLNEPANRVVSNE